MNRKVSQKNLPNRVQEARALARFGKIVKDTGSIFEVHIPGHDAKRYRVILKWIKTGKDWTLQSECAVETGLGHKDCHGNCRNICYHSMAAAILVAEKHGAKVSFAYDEASAMKLVNIKRRANRLFSRQSLEYIWIVS